MYNVSKVENRPAVDELWDSPIWSGIEPLEVANVHEKSSSHHPKVQLKLLYTAEGLSGRFLVKDQYVRSVAQNFQDMVCTDSCVEAFIEPANGEAGYLNFEMNCGGTLLVHWVQKSGYDENGVRFIDNIELTLDDIAGFEIKSTLPKINEPEIVEPTEWSLGFFIPFALFERIGKWPAPTSGTTWRANFYKCADKTSHPHWISWQVVEKLNFHQPDIFGDIVFG